MAEAAMAAGNAYSAQGNSAAAQAMFDMADTAFSQAMEAGYGQKGERSFDITNAWGNSFRDNVAYGGLGVAVPAAVASTVRNALENPISTAINIALSQTPLGLPNLAAKALTGETLGSVVTGLGRSLGETLGLSREGTNPEGYESADRGAMAALAGGMQTPSEAGSTATYGGGNDSQDSGIAPEAPATIPEVTLAEAPAKTPSYRRTLQQPSLSQIYAGLGRRSSVAPVSYTPGFNPFTAYAIPRRMAQGGYVPGGSGGMDDDVPAIIDGKGPARLSSGEFVFDAATVAALGDGNNTAGAKKLDGLRKAIRKKAYGHEKQPPQNYSVGDLVRLYDKGR
jgi:hypothetical protein